MSGRKPRRPSTVPSRGHTAGGSEVISAQKDAPGVTDLPSDRPATVIAFPEPPARRRRRWWLWGGTAVVLLIGGLIAYLVFSPALAVRTLDVQGNKLVSTAEVEEALEPLLGVSLAHIGDDDVRALLEDFAPVESVSAAAAPPSTLSVTIRERVPVAILASGGGFVLIDSSGRQLASVEDRASVALPLIDGGEGAVDSAVFSSIARVLAALPADLLARLVEASADSIDSVELSLTDGKTIFWGSAEENEAKAAVVNALLEAPPSDPPVEVYDVSTPTRPVTR